MQPHGKYNVTTMNVGIRELKVHLSHYLALARRGESIVVTDRGNPIARLEGIPPHGPPPQLTHLIDANKLVWKGPPRNLPAHVRMLPGDKSATDYIREQRR